LFVPKKKADVETLGEQEEEGNVQGSSHHSKHWGIATRAKRGNYQKRLTVLLLELYTRHSPVSFTEGGESTPRKTSGGGKVRG